VPEDADQVVIALSGFLTRACAGDGLRLARHPSRTWSTGRNRCNLVVRERQRGIAQRSVDCNSAWAGGGSAGATSCR
jgi:hypothetical protein